MVNLPEKQYPIYIERGLIQNIGLEIKKIYVNKRIFIITDNNVEFLYGNKIESTLKKEGFIVKKILIEPGENSKSFEALRSVCEEILEFGLSREDLIIAFGGGVVGDLGGFAASILLRGIAFIQIPTTLLAQVDSSVGGKVAINSKNGKNLIGSFYQPEAVFIDPDLLTSLSERVFNDGMAEVIKCAAIKDEGLFYSLLQYETKETLINDIGEIIYICCNIKKNVVQVDEKDMGERMLLNFGHTIGHVIEKMFNYETFTHGEAVAMGMIAITKNSETLGITEKGSAALLIKLINKYNLYSELPSMDRDEFFKALLLDKKNINEDINLILLKKIGCGFIKKVNRNHIDKYVD
ncbi:3-dehydroquinate synthase [Clostridium sp. CS001]|uniref:3-dehydroquinate synthase n=1 Tax=Clostridium sp. CS001 TaxID=2880648 RepID=UPI001CF4E68B|nr:3-dehydroquinate synthase [Clostridium sp. CS001]MCB2291091.1 3-dehydroquinate synthase [Clostridium sp. CS001]